MDDAEILKTIFQLGKDAALAEIRKDKYSQDLIDDLKKQLRDCEKWLRDASPEIYKEYQDEITPF